MKSIKKVLLFNLLFVLLTGIPGCKKESSGPCFGNGFHNGWADQNSIVIWTRLTKNPELNTDGQKFLIPTAEEHRRLDTQANPDSIYKAQIPEGYTLDQMEGACHDMAGEVKLS